MVASYSPPVSAGSWRPTARTLGALFAGSAVMFASTALNGDSLLAGGESGPITESAASPTGTGQGAFTTSPPAPVVSGPGQAAPWTPGAAPQWGSSLGDLPVRRAPVQETPRLAAPAPAASAEVAPVAPATSGSSVTAPAAPRRSAGDASAGHAGVDKPAPQAAAPRQTKPVDSVLGGVFHVAGGLSD